MGDQIPPSWARARVAYLRARLRDLWDDESASPLAVATVEIELRHAASLVRDGPRSGTTGPLERRAEGDDHRSGADLERLAGTRTGLRALVMLLFVLVGLGCVVEDTNPRAHKGELDPCFGHPVGPGCLGYECLEIEGVPPSMPA